MHHSLAAPRGRLGSLDRLRRQTQVRVVLRRGLRKAGAFLQFIAAQPPSDPATGAGLDPPAPRVRLAISVAKAAGNAPKRARLRRLVRAAFRALRHTWPSPADCLVIARTPWPAVRLADVIAELADLSAAVFRRWPPLNGRKRRDR